MVFGSLYSRSRVELTKLIRDEKLLLSYARIYRCKTILILLLLKPNENDVYLQHRKQKKEKKRRKEKCDIILTITLIR